VSKIYGELAEWWPLLSAPEDYAEEAGVYRQTMTAAAVRPVRSVLELGSGGGNNASFLKHDFRCTLVDLSPGMLGVSRRLNPECEHVLGDMRTLRLGRAYDAVFVHDAVMHMAEERELRQVLATAFEHTAPGGVALFAPDTVRERFRPGTDHGGRDGANRALRYLEWTWDPDPDDTSYLVDFALLLREGQGAPRVVTDRHRYGLFSSGQWLGWIGAAGFAAHRVPPADGPESGELFLGVRGPVP
jgi:SAM-dependent methyltransferase